MEILSLNIGGALTATLLNFINVNKYIKIIVLALLTLIYGITISGNSNFLSDQSGLFCMTIIIVTIISGIIENKNNYTAQILFLPVLLYVPDIWQKMFVLVCYYMNVKKSSTELNFVVLMLALSLAKVSPLFEDCISIFQLLTCSYLLYRKINDSSSSIIDKLVVSYSLINIITLLGNTTLVNIIALTIVVKVYFDKRNELNYNLIAYVMLVFLLQFNYVPQAQFTILFLSVITLVGINFNRMIEVFPTKHIPEFNIAICVSVLSLILLIASSNYNHIVLNILFGVFGLIYFLKIQNETIGNEHLMIRSVVVFVLSLSSIIGFIAC
jgi:hypothetical protein